jgi:hypothetical protein
MPSSRFFPAAILAVVLSALAGGFFGSSALATQDEVTQQYRVFTSALAAIEREYVEEVPSDRLVYSAIDGMLKTLDPHSSFFDPRSYRQLRERQEGRYYGLGIQIQVIDGDITVMSIFEGSPAYKKGLRRGDVIARIQGVDGDGRKTMDDAKGWTSDQAAPSWIRRPHRSHRRARRSQHHDRARRVHGGQGNRLHQAGRFFRDVGRRGGPGAEGAQREGHETPGIRSARQSRRPARSGHPHLESLPAPR